MNTELIADPSYLQAPGTMPKMIAKPKVNMAVGDINSDAIGSGARANGGKPPLELIPVGLIAEYHLHIEGKPPFIGVEPQRADAIRALLALGNWQRTGDSCHLYEVLYRLGDGWEECAWVFDYGREKYDEWNWAKGMKWSIPLACAARHLRRMIAGATVDAESGQAERGHVYCNVVMLLTYQRTYVEGDDRPRLLLSRLPATALPEALAA